jgi:hypothetical protein
MAARDIESLLASPTELPRQPSLVVRLKFVLFICGIPIAGILLSYSIRGANAFLDTAAGWYAAIAIAIGGVIYVGIGAFANRAYMAKIHKLGRADLAFRFTSSRMFRRAAALAVGGNPDIIDSSRLAVSASRAGFVIWAGSRPTRVFGVTWDNVTEIEVARMRYGKFIRWGMHVAFYDKFGMSGSMVLVNTNSGLIPLPSQSEARYVVAEMKRLRELGTGVTTSEV